MPVSFIQALLDKRAPVTIFLTNGVKLTGLLVKYECLVVSGFVLERERIQQFVFEKNISTIMPTGQMEPQP